MEIRQVLFAHALCARDENEGRMNAELQTKNVGSKVHVNKCIRKAIIANSIALNIFKNPALIDVESRITLWWHTIQHFNSY